MDKIKYTKFKNIDDIIHDLSNNSIIKKAVTRANLCKFWKKVVGEKFALYSKPYSMQKGFVMVIACKSPVVSQELLMMKKQLLSKFEPYAKSLNLRILDLKFDAKKWIDD